ncbi:MAG: hypothetical protein VX559_13340 [Pseudomonadota bacterium]|nr:hypothetical protein [Pseudomonadota bacterium]
MKRVITGHDGQGKSVFFKVESEAVTVGSPIVDWHDQFIRTQARLLKVSTLDQ